MLTATFGRALGFDPADTQALALPQGVKAQAHMLAQNAAVMPAASFGRAIPDRAGLFLDVAVEEFTEGPLANETDASGVFFSGIGQANGLGNLAHLGFAQLADRKQGLAELRLVEPVQEVALVLGRIQALEQLMQASLRVVADPCVMPGGNFFRPQPKRVIEKSLELDLGIAKYIGVGRAAGLVFAQELGEYTVLVLDGEVDMLDLDANDVSHRGGIDKIDIGGAILTVVVVFPVFHEDADHLVALLLEQIGADRRIDPPTQSDHHALLAHRYAIIVAMELRQLRYFVRVVELGSMSRAALDLNLVQSALSQQISRLEGELATRLLQRSPQGVVPTPAGLAFFREAQLTLRHAEQAARAAQQARLSGTVSVGLAPTTAAVLALPLMRAMRQRYPDVRLHMVESLSGHLATMLNARQLDLAVLFESGAGASQELRAARRWSVLPLLEEDLYYISAAHPSPLRRKNGIRLATLENQGLILPTGPHGLRSTLDAAFARAKLVPKVVLEIDSLAMLMEAVDAGLGATLQPWSAVARFPDAQSRFQMARISDAGVRRRNLLCGLSEEELSPAALAARVVMVDCVRQLVNQGTWIGASLVA